tara:strand:- start:540 stop:2039 length:1500 start_codon:yes stop_codon:yes gene_type:complete
MKIKNLVVLDYVKLKYLINIILTISLLYFFFLFLTSKINLENLFLFLILFSIHCSLFYIYLSSKKEVNYFPIYPLIIVYYFVTYSTYFYQNYELQPIFSLNFPDPDFSKKYIYPDIKQLIFILTLGLTSFSIGYFLLNYFVIKKNIKNLKLDWNKKIEYLLIIGFFLFIIFYYINLEKNFVNSSLIIQLKIPIMLFLLSYFQIKYLVSKNIIFNIILILLLSFLFIFEISRGSTLFPYLMIAIVIAINFFINRKINLLTILIIMISILVTNEFKYEIRKNTWVYGDVENNELIDKNQNKFLTNLNQTKEVYLKPNFDNIFNKENLSGHKHRLFHSNISLQIVLSMTPDEINYYEGKSYIGIIYKFLPRFLYKNKPSEEWGNFWGKRYLILNPDDIYTSWNFPILNEFYANFSTKGVVIGMFFLGFIIKLVLIFLRIDYRSPVLLSMASTIMLNFFFLESNLSLIVGLVINQLLFFSSIIFFMCFLNFLLKQISNLKIKI